MRSLRRLRSEETGIALIVALATLLILITLSAAIVASSIQTNTSAAQGGKHAQALAAAEAGLAAAVKRISLEPYNGSGSSSSILNYCFTTQFVAQGSTGSCTGQTDSLGSQGSYTYYVSPDMDSDCGSGGTSACWTNHTTSSCTGYPVTGPAGLTVAQRCVTSIGTYQGVSVRVQERVVGYQETFPVQGLESLSNILFDTNQPTKPYDGCPTAKLPPCPPVYLNGNFEANGTITIGGHTWVSTSLPEADVINGTIDRGPSGSVSLTDNTYNCPAVGSSASTNAYPGQTIVCSIPAAQSSSYTYVPSATLSSYTSTATTNNDAAINTANPSASPAPYTASTRAFSVSGTNSSSTKPITIPSGVYNFCSFTVNGGYVTIPAGADVIIYIDNSTTSDGCPTGGSDGQLNMPNAGFINNNSNPNSLIFNVCGDVSSQSGPCGTWSGLAPCSGGPSCPSISIYDTTSGGSSWGSQASPANQTLTGVACTSTTTCISVGNQGTIISTTNGGSNWTAQVSGTTAQLNGISCPSSTVCFAVGNTSGPGNPPVILTTTNGGTTWSTQTTSVTQNLNGISCASTTNCVAVGASGTVIATTNGGSTWTAQTSRTTTQLNSVSCASTSNCIAVGNGKPPVLLATTNGGSTWTSQTTSVTQNLNSIICPSTTTCFAAGQNGTIIDTTNGGTTWSAQTSGSTQQLNGVRCPSTTVCWAVGNSGTVLTTSNGGSTWTSQTSGTNGALNAVSCPSTRVCFAVGASTPTAAQTIGLVTLNDDLNTTGGPAGNGMTYGDVYAPNSAYTTTGNGLRWTGGLVAANWESNDNDWIQAAPGYSQNPTLDFYPVAYHRCGSSFSSSDPGAGCF